MRPLLALWRKECLALARDVHGLAVLFLMPAAFIVVMSLALSDAFKGDAARTTGFAVLAADAGLAGRVAQRLAGDGFRADLPPSGDGLKESVRSGKPALALLLPRDFEQALQSETGAPPQLTLIADPTLPPAKLLAFRQRVLGVVLALRVSAMAAAAGMPEPAAFDLERAASLSIETAGGTGRPSSVEQNVPAWLIFGMFFVVMPISSLFIVERREGTLARLASLQVPFSALLLGKIGPFFAVNLVQAGLMLLAGRFLVPWFGGEALTFPDRWDLLVVVAACTSLAAIGWGLAVAVCARTMEQATVIGGVGNILAAAIGGIMVPRFVMPESMQTLADLSPMAWALDGFLAVMLRHGRAVDIALPCLKLLALAVALLVAVIVLNRRALRP
jgi:ABC-2 type transport system permease protein